MSLTEYSNHRLCNVLQKNGPHEIGANCTEMYVKKKKQFRCDLFYLGKSTQI